MAVSTIMNGERVERWDKRMQISVGLDKHRLEKRIKNVRGEKSQSAYIREAILEKLQRDEGGEPSPSPIPRLDEYQKKGIGKGYDIVQAFKKGVISALDFANIYASAKEIVVLAENTREMSLPHSLIKSVNDIKKRKSKSEWLVGKVVEEVKSAFVVVKKKFVFKPSPPPKVDVFDLSDDYEEVPEVMRPLDSGIRHEHEMRNSDDDDEWEEVNPEPSYPCLTR